MSQDTAYFAPTNVDAIPNASRFNVPMLFTVICALVAPVLVVVVAVIERAMS